MVEDASSLIDDRPAAPVIITALMGPEDFAWADGLRRACYPPERNIVPAHITLFRHLPSTLLPEVADRMKRLCKETAPSASLTGINARDGTVWFDVKSEGLLALRDELADAFAGLLTPQDQVRPRLHITVQNKAGVRQARALAERLRKEFRPRPLRIAGLAAWHYRNGPWELAVKASFRG